jgi:hypothetical protein
MPPAIPPLDHLLILSDDTGVIQHAVETIPNRSTGYCTDDVARAYIVALQRLRLDPENAQARRLTSTYLSFLHDAQIEGDGRFHNFMSYARGWLDDVGTHDSCGRAMWALGFGVRYAPDDAWRSLSATLFDRALACIDWLEHPRAQCYAMLGLAHATMADPIPSRQFALARLADAMTARYERERGPQWEWFEDGMTYDNARLCEAVLRAGEALHEPGLREIGLRTLGFLEHIVFDRGIFVPIGNDGWHARDGGRALFAQQPLEAAAMVDAEVAAFDATADASYVERAQRAGAWFDGANLLGVPMTRDGGCYDGLEEGGPNRNMGAESTLAYLSAAYTLAEMRRLGKTGALGEYPLDDNSGVRST